MLMHVRIVCSSSSDYWHMQHKLSVWLVGRL